MRIRKNYKVLASNLKNYVEIWGKEVIDTDLGEDYNEVFIKKMWCDIIPTGGVTTDEAGNTISNDTKFKIKARKQELKTDNWIIYKGLRYDIKYILPNFNTNSEIEIYADLNIE